MKKNLFGSLLGLLTAGVIMIGCSDTPLGIDDSAPFPTEKLSLESSSILPEVALEAKLMGITGFEGFANERRGRGADDSLGHRRDDSTHHGNGRGHTNRLHALVAQLGLTDEQAVAIADCFNSYRLCADAIAAEHREDRVAAYEAFRAATAEIRAAVEDSSITRDSARTLLAAAVADYRAALQPIIDAAQSAQEACRADLIACIESNLTPEQLAKWTALLAAPPVGDDNPHDTRGPGHGRDDSDSTDNHGGRGGDDDSTDGDGRGRGRRGG